MIMSKTRFKLKLQGFELDIEGDNQQVAIAAKNITSQLAALVTPPSQMVSGGNGHGQLIDITPSAPPEQRAPSRRKVSTGTRSTSGVSASAIDFVNEPARFGAPSQSWNLVQKAMWTIFVVSEIGGPKSLSAGVIGRTFNKHFRQAGEIRPSNISRDLGRVKTKIEGTPALVGEDTTKSPSEWFLAEEGTRQVRELISKSIGGVAAAA
jgi:hypothetical protein